MLKRKSEKEKTKYSSVSLPLPLIKKVKKTILGTGYSSVGSFVEDLIRTALVAREERLKNEKFGEKMKNKKTKKSKRKKEEKEKIITEEDKKRLKDRLKALGYLD